VCWNDDDDDSDVFGKSANVAPPWKRSNTADSFDFVWPFALSYSLAAKPINIATTVLRKIEMENGRIERLHSHF
jgi:hypothetical protein